MVIFQTSDKFYRGYIQKDSKRGNGILEERDISDIKYSLNSKYNFVDTSIGNIYVLLINDKSNSHVCNITKSCQITIMKGVQNPSIVVTDLQNTINKNHNPEIIFYEDINPNVDSLDALFTCNVKLQNLIKLSKDPLNLISGGGGGFSIIMQNLNVFGLGDDIPDFLIKYYPIGIFTIIWIVGHIIRYLKR